MKKIIKILITFFFIINFFLNKLLTIILRASINIFFFSNTNVAQLQSMISRRWEFQDLFADSIIVT